MGEHEGARIGIRIGLRTEATGTPSEGVPLFVLSVSGSFFISKDPRGSYRIVRPV